tara:strand:- start:338 stop:973 length:636 start_codon:yes stop_codon:yes gene_type:complete
MIITCPDCKSNYKIEDNLIPAGGRKVKCFNCENFWLQLIDGEVKKLKLEDDFAKELTQRQNLIRSSLNNKNVKINSLENKNNLLNKYEEKEFLSSLAITEIEQNKKNENNSSVEETRSLIRVGRIRDKLNTKGENIPYKNKNSINKSYLGFILISIFCIALLILYQNHKLIINSSPIIENQLSGIINAADILIYNLTTFINKVINDFLSIF